jgi:NAD(P)-dependent dehydrogenase (short-subunit alcohol dehydrogenase family)
VQDEQVEAALGRVVNEHGAVDILINNVWGGYERMSSSDGEFTWTKPFWEQPRWRWDAMFRTGLRAAFMASAIIAPAMIRRQSGLIVNVSFWSAQIYMNNVMYGVSKAATDRLTADMAGELRPYQVAVVSLYPGLVRTERVMRDAQYFDLSNSESPRFSGRAVAALANDPHLMQRSGQVMIAAALAQEYGFTDVDGTRPRPLTLQDFSA